MSEADEKKSPVFERRDGCRNEPAFLLAILYTCGFFAFLMRLTYAEIPAANKEMINQIIPILGVIQAGIVQYFYQRAQQAQQEKKDETIKALATTSIQASAAIPSKVENMEVAANTATVTTGQPRKE